MVKIRAPSVGSTGLIPGWGTKIPHVMQFDKKKNSYIYTIGIYVSIWRPTP